MARENLLPRKLDVRRPGWLESDLRAAPELLEWLDDISVLREGPWDPAKHPRTGTRPNPGWFASHGRGGGTRTHADPSDPSHWHLPSDNKGTWVGGEKGEGKFRLKTPVEVNGKVIHEIEFKSKLPVLDKFNLPGKTATIVLTGDRKTDVRNAKIAWQKLNPKLPFPESATFHHDLLQATEHIETINGKKTKVLVGRMQLVPTEVNAAVFHEGSASAAKKFYNGHGINLETIKQLARTEAENAGKMRSVVGRASRKIKVRQIAKGILPFVGRNVARAIPIVGTGLAVLEFSDNVKAHGIGGAMARATPVLGDLIAAHDLGSDLAKEMIEKANAEADEHQRQLNAHVLPAWEKANEQTLAAFNELAPQIEVTNQPPYEGGTLVDPHEISAELHAYRESMHIANVLRAERSDFNFEAAAARNKKQLKEALKRASQKQPAPKRGSLG